MQSTHIGDLSSAPATTADRASKDVSLLDLLILLAARRRFILLFTLAIALLSLAIALLLPRSYTATAVILPPQGSSAGSAVMSQLGALGAAGALAGSSLGVKNPNDMYVAMFRSRSVESAMVMRFGLVAEYHTRLVSDAVKAFDSRSTVISGTKDNLISISVRDKDPRRAAELANGYVDEYRAFSSTLAITEAAQRRLFFEQQLQQAKDNLATAEEALKKTEQTTGVLQIDSQTRELIQSAASLRAQIAAKEVEIRGMKSFASDQNPELQLAEQQLAGWQAQLSSLGGTQSGSGDDLLLAKARVPGAGLEYVRKLRDVKYYDTIFDLLARQFEVAKLDEARQGSLVQVVDPAVPPDHKTSPRRGLILLVGTAVGFCLSILWVLVTAALSKVRNRPENRERLERLSLMFRKP
ncbi:MAG TPA: Wzz/FepE/Etk N-terminal domain-containing protein [Acidisarcina sp.]